MGKPEQVLAVAVTFAVLSWVTVALRVWVRAGMLRSFGRDDWAMLATQLTFTIYLVCQLGGVAYGTGRHLSEIEPASAETALAFWFFCEVWYTISTVLLKVAIGLFLLRVASKRSHVWIIWIVAVATVICGGAFCLIILLQCWPMHSWWSLDPNDGRCLSWHYMGGFAYTISVLNVIADWIYGILPAFIVKDLVMSKRQKIMVAGILAFAAIGSTATIVRLPTIHTLSESYLGRNGEFLYDTVGLAIWTTVEVGIGVTAGCIATLRPLLQLAFNKVGIKSSHHKTPLRRSKSGFGNAGLPLDNYGGLKPGTGIITTITGHRATDEDENRLWNSRSSSQEQLSPGAENIIKHTVVEYHGEDNKAHQVPELPRH
ncbi:hypothetical protein D0867_12341 [Hortaea werneckii]|uniref:Rhodopsin domain-containing protein n=2 Tax=Hortaea werneckii TaxID=91943 RepID=A0A3M6Y6Q0_HORWE|nr:hypothetical protein D0867_12341 [Hortaea werneckii]